MKIIFSIEPVRYPLTGIGRYAYELASGLHVSNSVDSLKLFSGTRFVNSIPQENQSQNNFYNFKKFIQKSEKALSIYGYLMPVIRKYSLRGLEEYIYHGPNYFIPPFKGRKIATFHDLSPFKWQDCFEPQKSKFLQKQFISTIENADALITDSNYIRQEIIDYFGFPKKNIFVAPLAASRNFYTRNYFDCFNILKKYNLKYKSYSFFVGTIEPRKNISKLLISYKKLPIALRARIPLVISGYKGWASEEIHHQIELAEKEGWAIYLGYIPEDELPVMYSGASLFIFPSLYEGFGLPVLEAMQSGIPVICSNAGSLPEVAGDSALLIDPDDEQMISDSIQEVLENKSLSEKLISSGQSNAKKYNWNRCVQDTINIYSKIP